MLTILASPELAEVQSNADAAAEVIYSTGSLMSENPDSGEIPTKQLGKLSGSSLDLWHAACCRAQLSQPGHRASVLCCKDTLAICSAITHCMQDARTGHTAGQVALRPAHPHTLTLSITQKYFPRLTQPLMRCRCSRLWCR